MNKFKATGIIMHAACWLIFFSLPILFMNNDQGSDPGRIIFNPSYWVFCITFVILFYLANYYLVPKLYLRRKYTAFLPILVVLFVIVFFLKPFDRLMSTNRHHGPPPGERPLGPPPLPQDDHRGLPGERDFDIVSVFLFLLVIALTMAIQINRELYLSERKAIKAEADRAEAELSFLKAQINPHFLFNTLNNIYTLAISSDPNTAESIMRLSNIMRYVTDDVSNDKVQLKDELDCISDFIGLQRLRLGKNTPIEYEVSGEIHSHMIAPLILMSFIENVFKYGISKQQQSPLTIKINADKEGIHFYSKNKIFTNNTKLSRTGIGIENTKQRLQHMYQSKHKLVIDTDNELFTVYLDIQA